VRFFTRLGQNVYGCITSVKIWLLFDLRICSKVDLIFDIRSLSLHGLSYASQICCRDWLWKVLANRWQVTTKGAWSGSRDSLKNLGCSVHFLERCELYISNFVIHAVAQWADYYSPLCRWRYYTALPWYFVTSAKGVMQSSLLVCLSVSNFAQKLPNGFEWNFQRRLTVGQWAND